MQHDKQKLEPIRQSVHVDVPIDDAFHLFTENFGEWWPLASYSTAGAEAENCEFEPWEGGKIFERTRSGEELPWGTVTHWDPPRRVEFIWDHSSTGEQNQTVEVEFSVEADGTRVTLTHHGWHLAGVETCFARFVRQQTMLAAC
ncbi:MAG TPA: SRPBCC domain-containing protein [Bryobacteraceae bacterium]|nr:SRPBCC domain-containing protein [Bryobacteraceae bacterium]